MSGVRCQGKGKKGKDYGKGVVKGEEVIRDSSVRIKMYIGVKCNKSLS